MNEITRREFLKFIGATGTVAAAGAGGALVPWKSAQAALALPFTPVRIASPLDVYAANPSFLATGLNGAGSVLPASPGAELADYTVVDDVIVPPEFERYVIASWGDRIFPNSDDYFGYNCDYTGFIPLSGTSDGLLWVNHEYTSYPFSEIAPGTPTGFTTSTFQTVIGFPLPTTKNREVLGETLYNVGGSIIRITRTRRGGPFAVNADKSRNRRIHGLSGLAENAGRTDGFAAVRSWGLTPHQTGDSNYLEGTGPAATDVFAGVNADTLGNKIIGTMANCSGGTTPWGTILSAEENFQGDSTFYAGVTEGVLPNGSQTGYTSGTVGAEFGLVGEKYGWRVEVNVKDAAVRTKKHTALGRFRCENLAFRVEAGKPLVVYMGDDRRGGHVWKFVSSGTVTNVTDPTNSALFESGTLYVAKFNTGGTQAADGTYTDGTGQWIPLALNTAVDPNSPLTISSNQQAQQSAVDAAGRVNLPRRIGIAGVTTVPNGGFFALLTTNQNTLGASGRSYYDEYKFVGVPGATPSDPQTNGAQKTLADYYTTLGAALCDAYPAANLIGGTPCARPEDIEVHPVTKDVYIAMTDGRPSSDGYPDSRFFVVAKYKAPANTTKQQGGVYRISETGNDGAATTFAWARFVQGGDDGSVIGSGFANVDNLVFDTRLNLWGVTDMSTNLHNAIGLGPTYPPSNVTVDYAAVGSSPAEGLVGVYGNNWMFYMPTSGANAGEVVPFAIGPCRCEMTGPTFVGGDTLILSVQHPGEDSPFGGGVQNYTRSIPILKLDGSATFNQSRTIPTGSAWPSNAAGQPQGVPKPTVIGIRRKTGGSFV